MKTAGLVLDFYDDPSGELLRRAFPSPEALPEVVKTAHILTSEEREVLRDDAFALVLHNEGKVLRKFACVDAGNTLLSALYYLENRDALPEEAQKVAEARLFEACEEFGLPMDALVKQAARTSMSRTRSPGDPEIVGDEQNWAERTNLLGVKGSTDSSKVLDSTSKMKTASPLVDVSGLEPALKVKRASASRHALDGHYPLDSYGDVQAAVRYFEERHLELTPAERHEYAVKTAARADELGVSYGELLERYGSTEYAPDVEAHLAQRRALAETPEDRAAYGRLQTKLASIGPDAFAELLGQVDAHSGLERFYGRIADPYLATFGGDAEAQKLASWSWTNHTGVEVNGEQLSALAASDKVGQHFDASIAEAFKSDPTTIFDSLPTDTKTLLARLATE